MANLDQSYARPAAVPGEIRLPWDEEAERAILGAILLDPEAYYAATETLRPDDFHRSAHSAIFRAFIDLAERREAIDPVTLRAELLRIGKLELAGGDAYIGSLISGLPRAANVPDYAKIVKDRSLLRAVLGAADELRGEASAGVRPAADVLEEGIKNLFTLSEEGRKKGFQPIADVGGAVLQQIEEMSERRELVTGLSTGYDRLDKMLSGLQKGDMLILAARPSMGKTALALNIAQNAAVKGGATVGVFSLEMSSPQLFYRLLSSQACVDLQKLRTGSLAHDDWDNVGAAYTTLVSSKIFIDDTPGIGPMELLAKARRLKHEEGLGLIVVDYLQLMKLETRIESRQQEVSEISRSLKAIAKELDVPILALSQLSRAPDQGRGSDHRPQLSDLRESGAIEQDADVVMFIFRPEVYVKEKEKVVAEGLEGKAELIVAKQRNGPTGVVDLFFVKQFARFENQADAPIY
ncbi:MAG: replicative DNA helicase [Candidatus Polarisedimenticolia bacterium]